MTAGEDWRIHGDWGKVAAKGRDAVEIVRLMIAVNKLDTLSRSLYAAFSPGYLEENPKLAAGGDQIVYIVFSAGILKEAADAFRQLNKVATRLFRPLKGTPPVLSLAQLRVTIDPDSDTWGVIESIRDTIGFHWEFEPLRQSIDDWPTGDATIMVRQTAPKGRGRARYVMGDVLVAKGAFTRGGRMETAEVAGILRRTAALFMEVSEVLIARFLKECGCEMEQPWAPPPRPASKSSNRRQST